MGSQNISMEDFLIQACFLSRAKDSYFVMSLGHWTNNGDNI